MDAATMVAESIKHKRFSVPMYPSGAIIAKTMLTRLRSEMK